jgi:hypothetical protein
MNFIDGAVVQLDCVLRITPASWNNWHRTELKRYVPSPHAGIPECRRLSYQLGDRQAQRFDASGAYRWKGQAVHGTDLNRSESSRRAASTSRVRVMPPNLGKPGRRQADADQGRELATAAAAFNRVVHIRLLANQRDKPNPHTLPSPGQLHRSHQIVRIPRRSPLRPVANA